MPIERLMRPATTVVAVASVFGLAFAGDKPRENGLTSSVADQLVGSWRLVSRVTTAADGTVLKNPGVSATPNGVLIYDRSGHVAAQASRPGRTVEMLWDECRVAQNLAAESNNSQAISGYDAYFGTYTVDVKEGVVTHHLEGALFPGDLGKNLKRNFAVSGDTLTITYHATTADGTQVLRTLVWTRLK